MRRRHFGLGMLAAVAARTQMAAAAAAHTIDGIERLRGGRLGVFVRDMGSGRSIAHRADETFLLQSTFKGPLAAMMLARVDAGREGLDRSLRYGPWDLVPGSPVTAAHLASGRLTTAELLAAILERSDNAAANLLLKRLGGPAALTAWLRSTGDAVTAVNRYEALAGQTGPENTTTPRAIAATAARISLGTLLRPPTRTLNNAWMAANTIAAQRPRGGLPRAWPAIDRTGTDDNVRNDYAIAFPPGHAPIVIAAYYEKRALAPDEGESVLRAVGCVIAQWVNTPV